MRVCATQLLSELHNNHGHSVLCGSLSQPGQDSVMVIWPRPLSGFRSSAFVLRLLKRLLGLDEQEPPHAGYSQYFTSATLKLADRWIIFKQMYIISSNAVNWNLYPCMFVRTVCMYVFIDL